MTMQPINENRTAAESTKKEDPMVHPDHAKAIVEKVKFNLGR